MSQSLNSLLDALHESLVVQHCRVLRPIKTMDQIAYEVIFERLKDCTTWLVDLFVSIHLLHLILELL